MDLQLIKDIIKDYRFLLSKSDEFLTQQRILSLKNKVRQLETQIDIIERWEKLSIVTQANELLPHVSGRVCFSHDCFYHDKTTDTCVGDYAKCTVKRTIR